MAQDNDTFDADVTALAGPYFLSKLSSAELKDLAAHVGRQRGGGNVSVRTLEAWRRGESAPSAKQVGQIREWIEGRRTSKSWTDEEYKEYERIAEEENVRSLHERFEEERRGYKEQVTEIMVRSGVSREYADRLVLSLAAHKAASCAIRFEFDSLFCSGHPTAHDVMIVSALADLADRLASDDTAPREVIIQLRHSSEVLHRALATLAPDITVAGD